MIELLSPVTQKHLLNPLKLLMKIWLITSGEIIPLENERSCRTGILSSRLADAGHHVTWWTTTYDHQTKTFIFNKNTENLSSNGVKMIYLHSKTGYKKNISLKRLKNHRQVSYSFSTLANKKEKPDLIFCSFPTIELSYEAVKYGVKNSVPVIIDIRDLWPDLFYNPFKKWMRPVIKIALFDYIRRTKYLFKYCNAITAISQGYLNWGLNYSKRQIKEEDRVFPLGYEKVAKTTSLDNIYSYKGLDASKIIIWFVGTFGQTYNLNTVIKAAQILNANKRNDIQFVLTGDGEKMNEWSKLAYGLNNVIFTGWVNKNQLNYLSGIADIGLMAYNSDATQGLPNKLFEYMSAGIPILSSLQGETNELIKSLSIGQNYQADSVEMFLFELLILADNPDKRKEFGHNGLNAFQKEYSSDVVYKKLVEYLENYRNN